MKDNPDMGTQSSEERIDELLNGYIDDELAARQHTEVERLIAHDPKIKQRVEQLRKCKTLLASLPVAEAPPQILEAVQTSLASTAEIYEQSSYGKRMGRIHLMARRMLSAAAMLALVGVLAWVIFTIVTPPTQNQGKALAFSGRLELTTDKLREVGAIVSTAIAENGLSDSAVDVSDPTRRVYHVKCSREGLDSLLAGLEYAWTKLDSAAILIDTESSDSQMAVGAVTPRQIAEIVDQQTYGARLEKAKEFAMLNSQAEGRPATDNEAPGLPPIPKPIIVGPSNTTQTTVVPEAEKTIRLTIILSK